MVNHKGGDRREGEKRGEIEKRETERGGEGNTFGSFLVAVGKQERRRVHQVWPVYFINFFSQ